MPPIWKPPRDLPNIEGFQFIGRFQDGSIRGCVVATRPVNGVKIHTVEKFAELREWRALPEGKK